MFTIKKVLKEKNQKSNAKDNATNVQEIKVSPSRNIKEQYLDFYKENNHFPKVFHLNGNIKSDSLLNVQFDEATTERKKVLPELSSTFNSNTELKEVIRENLIKKLDLKEEEHFLIDDKFIMYQDFLKGEKMLHDENLVIKYSIVRDAADLFFKFNRPCTYEYAAGSVDMKFKELSSCIYNSSEYVSGNYIMLDYLIIRSNVEANYENPFWCLMEHYDSDFYEFVLFLPETK